MYRFKSKLENLLVEEFPEIINPIITPIGNALTTKAFRIKSRDIDLIAKIAFDPKDIEEGKGDKEVYILNLLQEHALPLQTPKVYKYLKTNKGFPGYIIFLEVIPGRVYTGNSFVKIATEKQNIKLLGNCLNAIHSIKYNYSTDFATFKQGTIEDYLDKYIINFNKRIGVSIVFPKGFEPYIKYFTQIKEYFKNNNETVLLHRDANFKNILIDNKKITSLIDWEGAFTGPKSFDFAHVSILAPTYGVSKWHNSLTEYYANEFTNNPSVFINEVIMVKLFTAFRYLSKDILNPEDANRKCIETNEPLWQYFKREIDNWKFPF